MNLRLIALLALLVGTAFPSLAENPTQSLAGTWRFALDRDDVGTKEKWFERDLPNRIALPGILQAQGFGDEIRVDTPWVLTLGDAWWKLQPESLRAPFSRPGHVEVPFLSQPPRHYLGSAWYQRDIEVPSSWAGRQLLLFLERTHWQTAVWLDATGFAPDSSLGAPHTVNLGAVTPGRHRLSIRVDNRQIVRDAAGDGHGVDGHSVSDSLGATWNGIVGRIELSAATPVWIEDAQVYPHVATKSASVKVLISNGSGEPGSGTLTAGGVSIAVNWDAVGGAAQIEVPLGPKAGVWDEFHPNLQHLKIVLKGPNADDARSVTFGLREITHRDKDLLINGSVVNLRMNHFGGDFPLTGYPATDTASWRRIFRVLQDYGLNGMRFHSWCPPEAAFEAADELGFYLQPECSMWSPFRVGGAYTAFLEEETARILRAFGNHPSFILLSPSNEPSGAYEKITPAWAAACFARDGRRLYSAGTGWSSPAQVAGGAQYASLVAFNRVQLRNVNGWFGRDYREALADVHIPVLAHEVGQWCAYPDFRVIDEFTGYLRPGNYSIFKYIAEQNGVLGENQAFAWASGRFQLQCYKEEIEANLRTPGLSGFQLLDLHDYLGQGTALIGVVDAFWNPKSYVTAAEFRRFSGPTVPLARLAKRTFTTAEALSAEVELYHFGGRALSQARPFWRVTDSKGHSVAEGRWPARDVAIGKNIPLGNVMLELSTLAAPASYTLTAGIEDTPVANGWDFWLYPAKIDASTPAGVVLANTWAVAASQLAAGQRVLFCPAPRDLDPAKCPPMKRVPVFWNIQMTVRPPRNPTPRFDAMLGLLCDSRSPALAEFPTGAACDWQWTPLIDNVRSINLENAPRSLRPIVAAIDDWNRNWRLGVIFECAVGTGRLLVSAINLENPDATPGERQLRRSLLDYMSSDRFTPKVAVTPDQAGALFAGHSPGSGPNSKSRAFDPDLDDGTARPARPARPSAL